MIVKCNRCGALVEVGDLARRHVDGFEIEYFICDGCGAEFIAAVTDAALREDILRYKSMIMMSKQNGGVSEAYMQEVLDLKERNTRRSNELRERIKNSVGK